MASSLKLFAILTPIGLSWLGALIVWWVGDRRPRAQHVLAVVFALAAALAALLLIPLADSQSLLLLPAGPVFTDFTFVADGLGLFLTLVATLIGSLAVLFSVDYMHGAAGLGRYYSLVLLFIGAMSGLALSGNLLLLFIFWEMTALCSYALISFHSDDPKAVAGGVKALIITQVGGVGLLGGTLAAYAYLGDYQISTLLAGAPGLPAGVLSFIAFGFLLAAMAKSAQVPLHSWLPGAMEAPTPVSALIHAATMVNAGVYLLVRFYPAFAPVPGWKPVVLAIGMLTALMAAVMALLATDLKRVLAYSTASQLGYMVYAVGVGALFASQFHLLSHAVFKALLFLGAGVVIHAVGTRDMRQMGGLGRRMPVVAVTFTIGAAALAGLPFFNGFWSKELVLERGLEAGPLWAYLGMMVGVGLTALYTCRMVWLVFLGSSYSTKTVRDATPAMRLALLPLALGTATTWLLAGPFGGWLERTLPFHELHIQSTADLVADIGQSSVTLLALAVVGVGLVAWWGRGRLARPAAALGWLRRLAEAEFGFEWAERRLAGLIRGTAEALQSSQTGQLNWNVLGIVAGLIIVLAVLAGGRLGWL